LYYCITDHLTLNKVRDHFNRYPPQSTKFVHFQLWSRVLDMSAAKEHLTREGFLQILAIKSLFPKSLNETLRTAFPSIPLVKNPEFIPSSIALDPYWITGFANGDGNFSLGSESDLLRV
jgi:hypothetical protein